MSRAFVKESDQDADDGLPERPLSPHPNFVTPAGLHQIEAQIRALEARRVAARAADDTSALASTARDLRYWTQRRASARVVEVIGAADVVRFGLRVALLLEDGTERSFRLVGEDEADPAQGRVSWVSPVATALLGRAVGDTVDLPGCAAQIVRIEP